MRTIALSILAAGFLSSGCSSETPPSQAPATSSVGSAAGSASAVQAPDTTSQATSASAAHATAAIASPSPATQWQELPRMLEPRKDHTLSALEDGSVVAIGGRDPHGNLLASVERLRPDANSWELLGRLNAPRADHTATVLGDQVLVVGGSGDAADSNDVALSTSERFDLKSLRASAGPALRAPRKHHAALMTENRQIWIIGGGGTPNPGDSEVLVEGGQRFEFGPQRQGKNLEAAWVAGNAVVLAESHRGKTLAPIPKFSRLLNAGRTQEPPLIELLDASSATPLAQRLPATRGMTATPAANGILVLAEVSNQWQTWLFDPQTHQFTPRPAPPPDALGFSLITGPGKQPMILGELASARFDGTRWLPLAKPPIQIFGYALASTPSSLVLAGGSDRSLDDRGVTARAFRLSFSEPSKARP